MNPSTQSLFGRPFPFELISNILVLLVAFGIYRLGLFLAKPKVHPPEEDTKLPTKEESTCNLSLSEEHLSLLREIRDNLKEQQNHE